jgi:hypothetical protein
MLPESQLRPAILPLLHIDGIATGETISPVTLASPVAIAGMTEREKSGYITALLRHDEMGALEVVSPLFRQARTFAAVFEHYRPMIEVLKTHFCQLGRPRRSLTWSKVVKIYFGVGIRRMQQMLCGAESWTR